MCLEHIRALGHKPFGIYLTALTVAKLPDRFRDLPPDQREDLVFENGQAPMRRGILMNSGFVIGTGDVSESALGWCTYNGDHMSMYNPNSSIPKTLVKFLVEWAARNEFEGEARRVLLDIVDTLIAAGIAGNRAEAIRWALTRIRERPAYEQLREHTRDIERLKKKIATLDGDDFERAFRELEKAMRQRGATPFLTMLGGRSPNTNSTPLSGRSTSAPPCGGPSRRGTRSRISRPFSACSGLPGPMAARLARPTTTGTRIMATLTRMCSAGATSSPKG